MAEGARLESVYTATYRGFESPPHRHIRDESSYESTGFFLLYSPLGGMRTPDRVRQLAQLVGQTANAVSGLPRRGERSESIPPSPPYSRKELVRKYGLFSHLTPVNLPGVGINASPGLPIPQAAPPPVARPGTTPPGIPQAEPPTVARPGAAPPGKCCENNKARDIPGFAHSLAFSNRLSTFAGKALNARSHRW